MEYAASGQLVKRSYSTFSTIFSAQQSLMKKHLLVPIAMFCFISFHATAQLTENFSDGDFSNNPAWTGNTADWIVNASLQLQSSTTIANSPFYLSTASTLATQAQWDLFVRLAYNPSSQNYVDVYLTASDSNLTNTATTGYFVHLGGTADDISLFRKDATGDTVRIIDGVNGTLNTSNNQLRLRVTCSATGVWNLSRDLTGSGVYTSEGTVTDATYTTSSYFGFFVKSTSSYFGNHYFDDINIHALVPDVTPPVIQSATVVSSTMLDVLFNEAVDAATVQAATNYVADNGIGSPATAVLDISNPALVHLTFAAAFPIGTTNTLTVNNVTDLASNPISNGTITFIYSPDVTPPLIVTVAATTPTTVNVLFSEPVDAPTAQQLTNYSVDNSIGNPVAAQIDVSNPALVHLTFAAVLTVRTVYTMAVSNVQDIAGNTIATPNSTSFSFIILQQFDVVINEIMADPDPAVALPNTEYVEIKNVSGSSINVQDWRLKTSSAVSGLFPAFVLPADSFLVLTSTGNAALFSGNVIGVTSFPSLTNSGTTLSLISREGYTIHTVRYTDTWYQNDVKKNGGWSLEMIDTHNPCSGIDNWKASIDPRGGTPGAKNSIDGNNPDQTPPVLIRAAASDSVTVILTFSETVDSLKASTASNYIINNGIPVVAASAIAPEFTKVQLTLGAALVRDDVYTVTANNISDCSGNTIQTLNTARIGLPGTIDSFDIVINELLFNPKPNSVDYIEIYNRSSKILDLKDLYFSNGSGAQQVTADNFLMFAGDYYVLSQSGATVKQEYVAQNPGNFIDVSMPSLPDDKGTVVLLNTQGAIIDRLNYDAKWHFALIDNDEGISLERVDYNKPTQDPQNWHSAASTVGYGTPSYQNSQFRADVSVAGEVTVTPKVFSPDNDGTDDFATVNYQLAETGYVANITIFDASGRPVRALAKNATLAQKGSFRWDGLNDKQLKVPVGAYIVYTEFFNLSGKKKSFKNTVIVAASF